MSLVSIIKDLYEITRPGGRANTSTGSVSGSLAEQIEYIADNSGGGGGSFLTSPLAARTADSIVPGLNSPGAILVVGSGGVAGHGGLSNSPTYTWDASAEHWFADNTSGQNSYVRLDLSANFVDVRGVGGKSPAWHNPGSLLVQPATDDTIVVEFHAHWSTAFASIDLTRGMGVGNATLAGSNPWNAVYQFAMFYRKTGSGWTLCTSDGSIQEQSEGSDTSDGAEHVFRIEYDGTNVRLYVDGTLKITNSTNVPDFESQIWRYAGFRGVTGDTTSDYGIAGVLMYWKTA